jgi:hypothetical protein
MFKVLTKPASKQKNVTSGDVRVKGSRLSDGCRYWKSHPADLRETVGSCASCGSKRSVLRHANVFDNGKLLAVRPAGKFHGMDTLIANGAITLLINNFRPLERAGHSDASRSRFEFTRPLAAALCCSGLAALVFTGLRFERIRVGYGRANGCQATLGSGDLF